MQLGRQTFSPRDVSQTNIFPKSAFQTGASVVVALTWTKTIQKKERYGGHPALEVGCIYTMEQKQFVPTTLDEQTAHITFSFLPMADYSYSILSSYNLILHPYTIQINEQHTCLGVMALVELLNKVTPCQLK